MERTVPDWITGFLKYTDNSEPPLLYREWVAVSVIAAHLQRRCKLDLGELTFYPNMYIILVGPPGRCRKGTAMSVGAKFLRESGIKMAAESVTREALIRELAGSQQSEITTNGDITFHASLTVFAQELTVFLGQHNLALMMDLTDWYDCRDTWVYRTKNMGTDDIQGVWVNLIGATTPELIQTSLPRDAIGGGFASRAIFVYEEQKGKVVPMPILSMEEVQLREELVNDLSKIILLSGTFKITKGFLNAYVEWYTQQENHPFLNDPNFAGYVERRPTHILKLSMIMSAACRDDMTLVVEDFNKALSLLTRTEKKMPRTFRGYGASSMAQVVGNIMQYIELKIMVSRRDLIKTFLYDLDGIDQLDNIIATLKEMRFIKETITTSDTTYARVKEKPAEP